MSRAAQSFTQNDVAKALKAAVKAGLEVNRFEIDRTGKIVVVAGKAESAAQLKASSDVNEWDGVVK
jgi:nitrate reductase NapAB chaperone NapD